MTARRRSLGAWGENETAKWYQDQGYQVVESNWRCHGGEIDLVASRGKLHVFCEVKTRSSDRFGVPAEAVGPQKQARLRKLAARWLAESPRAPGRWVPIRFDVAAVMTGSESSIEVIEGAF